MNKTIGFSACMVEGEVYMPTVKVPYKGTKFRVDGTEKIVTVVERKGTSAIYKGENIAGTIEKMVDGSWRDTKTLNMSFLDLVDFGDQLVC